MIKIYPRINAVIGATMDRMDVRKFSGKKLEHSDDVFYKTLVEESGDSSNNFVKILKNWRKAYSANLKKNMMVSDLKEQMDADKSFFERIGLK